MSGAVEDSVTQRDDKNGHGGAWGRDWIPLGFTVAPLNSVHPLTLLHGWAPTSLESVAAPLVTQDSGCTQTYLTVFLGL